MREYRNRKVENKSAENFIENYSNKQRLIDI